MNALAPTLPRVAKLLPLLGSDRDGEVVATARAIGRTLAAAGMDWHALAAILAELVFDEPRQTEPATRWAGPSAWASKQSPAWRDLARKCAARDGVLGDRERGFVRSMAAMPTGWTPTTKQTAWLRDIDARLREAA